MALFQRPVTAVTPDDLPDPLRRWAFPSKTGEPVILVASPEHAPLPDFDEHLNAPGSLGDAREGRALRAYAQRYAHMDLFKRAVKADGVQVVVLDGRATEGSGADRVDAVGGVGPGVGVSAALAAAQDAVARREAARRALAAARDENDDAHAALGGATDALLAALGNAPAVEDLNLVTLTRLRLAADTFREHRTYRFWQWWYRPVPDCTISADGPAASGAGMHVFAYVKGGDHAATAVEAFMRRTAPWAGAAAEGALTKAHLVAPGYGPDGADVVVSWVRDPARVDGALVWRIEGVGEFEQEEAIRRVRGLLAGAVG